jgi:hypothetical protein
LATSGSEARDMLSGETVVGGVELNDAILDASSVGVTEKLLESDMMAEANSAIGIDEVVGVAVAIAATRRRDDATIADRGWVRKEDGRLAGCKRVGEAESAF